MNTLLFITDRNLDRINGESAHVVQIVNALNEIYSGRVVVLSPSGSPRFDNEVIQVPYGSGGACPKAAWLKQYAALLKAINQLVRAENIEIVYLRNSIPLQPLLPLIGKMTRRAALLVEVNGLAVEEMRALGRSRLVASVLQRLDGILLNTADHVIAVAEPIRDALRARGVQKISVVENAADVNLFRPMLPSDDLRNALGIVERDPVVGFVGHITKWQGVDILVQSAKTILDSFERAKFVVVGDGPALGEVKATVQKLSIDHAFRFVGSVPHDEVPEYISLFTCAVTPTVEIEGAGAARSSLKTFEYLACGVPCVVSDFPGISSQIAERRVGYAIKSGDPDSLAESICKVLSWPADKALATRTDARSLIVNHHTWRHAASRILRVAEQR